MSGSFLWGIHGGKTSDADTLFKNQKVIALGWAGTPDLSTLPDDREAFKDMYRATFPDKSDGNVISSASQLYRFVHEMKEGDLVAYPSRPDRRVYLGRVTGPYQFKPRAANSYCHQRTVTWLKDVPRTSFSQGALYEMGAAQTLFQIKNYADEQLALLEGKQGAASDTTDETIGVVADQIRESTRDYIVKTLARDLKGKALEYFVAHLLETMGYHTRVAPEGTDGGIDIIAHRDGLGFEPPIIKVQVKSEEGTIGQPTVSSLYGHIAAGEFGLFVTLGTFTRQASEFARSKGNLRLVDAKALIELVLEHYDAFDAKYKGILSLKSVYIPEQVEQDEES